MSKNLNEEIIKDLLEMGEPELAGDWIEALEEEYPLKVVDDDKYSKY